MTHILPCDILLVSKEFLFSKSIVLPIFISYFTPFLIFNNTIYHVREYVGPMDFPALLREGHMGQKDFFKIAAPRGLAF